MNAKEQKEWLICYGGVVLSGLVVKAKTAKEARAKAAVQLERYHFSSIRKLRRQ